ncbi:MAG: UvrD-helicase domain-containing protein, partial [Corallococcus sp.]|nr:UvrD-helicase domain-containing protein [Corallococcus sp.]
MSEKKRYTESQRNVIDCRGDDMLVSASAGTGKTTVMIERIASLLAEGTDVSEIVVVTFTNLAAAEMKNRLAAKLAENKDNARIIDQLERLDGACISTLHSFCSELLRNYFYVADIDPSFTVLDGNTTST